MNRRILLRSLPVGVPHPDDFALEDAPSPQPGTGELLIEVTHLSIDPFPRLRMCEHPVAGPPIRPGDVIDSRGIGRVVESRHADYAIGDHVSGDVGWQSRCVLPGDAVQKIDLELGTAERHLSVLGPSGLSAYFAMHVVGQPSRGERVLIAPAAGSVGSLAAQIAKRSGAHVIGVGRGEDQSRRLLEMPGIDKAIDSEKLEDVPDRIDLFLDGVGGALHEAVLRRLAPRARIVLLGFISAYGEDAPPRYGNAAPVLFRRARMEGFLLADWQEHFPEARARLSEWLRSGEIVPAESIWEGLERAPEAFAALFGQAPPGKQIVRLLEETPS